MIDDDQRQLDVDSACWEQGVELSHRHTMIDSSGDKLSVVERLYQ
jgi:hypothetical protein